jgi:hypothetical protein
MKSPRTKVAFAERANPKDQPTFGDLGSKVDQIVKVDFAVGRSFGDEFTPDETRAYRNTYHEQLPDVLAELAPVNYLKEPQVLLRFIPRDNTKNLRTIMSQEMANGCWVFNPNKLPPDDNRFFNYVSIDFAEQAKWSQNISEILFEEVWAAQENLDFETEEANQKKEGPSPAVTDAIAIAQATQPDPNADPNSPTGKMSPAQRGAGPAAHALAPSRRAQPTRCAPRRPCGNPAPQRA